MIRFACPNCKKGLKAPPDKGGMKTICPACKVSVVVPAAEPEPPPVPTSPFGPTPVAQPVSPVVPVAKPVLPPPVVAVAITPSPAPSPPRSEPVVLECRRWVEFVSALRDEDDGERHLDLGGTILAEARKRLDGYATSVPHHNAAGFGTRATITGLTEWCVYSVSVGAVFETRRLGSGEAAYSGWRLPAAPAEPARLDVWDFRYRLPAGLTGRSENILYGTQVARSCEPCCGRGDATCATCGGGRVVACPRCQASGTEPCRQCRGRLVLSVDTGTQQRWESCGVCGGTGEAYALEPGRMNCRRCAGRGLVPQDVAATQTVPCPCRTGLSQCLACDGRKQLRCSTCTGTGRSKCDRCLGGKQLVRYAILCRTFEPWERTATTTGSGGEPEIVQALSRLRAHQPLARLLITDTPDPSTLETGGVGGTARSLLEAIRTETTADRRPACLALEVGRATAVRVGYEYGKHQHFAWLLGRDRAVHAPASPLTDALAEKLSRAAKDWRQEKKKEAVALVREAVAMGEKDVFCRAALDTGRAKLPPDLWSAATNPGVLGAVAEGIGKLFGRWFG